MGPVVHLEKLAPKSDAAKRQAVSTLLNLVLVGVAAALLVLVATFGARAFGDQALIGGTPADPKDWPASVRASMSGASCSATVVGERVLLIAAHCVANNGQAKFSVGPNAYTAKCTHHPDYKKDDTADWSLCVVDKAVAGVPYEVVGTSKDFCQKGVKLRLTGYGCVRSGGGGGNDGVYRTGEATIQSCPSKDHDTVTKGGAALCYGDSGGPAFLEKDDGSRLVIGVNSRGNIKDTSYLSSTFDGAFSLWAAAWSGQQGGLKICGVHAEAKGCRDGGAEPPPPPPPADCSSELATVVDAQADASAAVAALKSCLDR